MTSCSELIIKELGGYDALSIDMHTHRAIRADKVDALTDLTIQIIADLAATLIDAGSEREAVEENDALRDAIRAEYTDWSL